MRQIKFRVWIPSIKQMRGDSDAKKFLSINADSSCNAGGDNIYMQFTGLKDKNGKEIYEGDVLQVYEWDDINHKDKKRFISTVDFRRGAFMVYDTLIEQWRAFENLARPGEPYEVIGNIYENPELLSPQ